MVLDNKQKLLIGLVVVLALVLTYRLANPFRQETVAKLTYGRTNRIPAGSADASGSHAASPPTKIMTALLTTPTPLEQMTFRDPFRRPTPKAMASPPEQTLKQPESRTQSPEQHAKEALGRFKTFGAYTQGDRTSLFLQRGKQVLVVKVGDRIDGRFTIEAIDGLSVLVTTTETAAPFRFEFEELPSDDSPSFSSSSATTGRRPTSPTTNDTAPIDSDDEYPAADEIDEVFPEEDEDRPPPDLPDPPPIDSPTQPFKSSDSPSRSYLPGTKPPDRSPETE